MNNRPETTQKPKWWTLGNRPDYRFSLANERTFLAWIRTSLALIAGAIGIDQFAIYFGPPVLRTGLALLVVLAGGTASALSYKRWVLTESAMRHNTDIPHTRLLPALAVFIALLAVAIAVVILAI